MAENEQIHVVLGANGGLGNAVVRVLSRHGKKVRAVTRSGNADVPESTELAKADTTDKESLMQACAGASVVYHCVNVPYPEWHAQLTGMMQNILDAAIACGAKLVYGDNLYMYGYIDGPIREDAPHAASDAKGILRARLANMVLSAHREGKLQATIGRAPDFFGPHVFNAAMGERVFKPALQGKTINLIGNIDAKHSYSFVEDFALGLMILAENERALGEAWHIPSAETMTTRSFLELVFEATGRRSTIRVAPKMLLAAMGLINPMMRELKEILYQWDYDYVIDHSKFLKTFTFQPTPHAHAIRQTVEWFKNNT